MPGWHRVFSNSSLDVTMPQDDVTMPQDDVRGLGVIATHRGHCVSDCMEEQRAVNKSNLPSVSVSGQDQNICSCVTEFGDLLCLELDGDVMKWETWYDITLLWQNPQSFCEKLPLNVMTGCIRLSSRIHDWYKLQLPWCHLFEKKDIFQKFTAVLHRHKENKYRMSFFPAYTTRCCVKIWLTSEDIHFVA